VSEYYPIIAVFNKKINIGKHSTIQKKEHTLDYKATHYTAKDELSPLESPKETLKFILANLPKDNDWSRQFESLDYLRRIFKNHEDFYPTLTQNLPAIIPELLKLVESLRSSVAKNAMITLSEMCEAMKKAMDGYLEPIFVKLFRKTQDSNNFIVEEVRRCMGSLCSYCNNGKICGIVVLNSNVKAIPIKLNVGFCIDRILARKDYDCQILKENTKVVSVMSNMVLDGSSEVRSLAR
jgi:hypothetical protein